MFDPFAAWPVSASFADHLARRPPSAGGTDYAVQVGTEIRAAFTGTLRNRITYPAGFPSLFTAILTSEEDPALGFYHLHLSRFVDAGPVIEGQLIGYTGGALRTPGSGTATGPHLHVNAYREGILRDVHDFYAITRITPAGLTAAQMTEKEEQNMQLRFITRDTTSPWYVTDGITKRALAPGENQFLVDLGLATYEVGNRPKIVGPSIDLIPTERASA